MSSVIWRGNGSGSSLLVVAENADVHLWQTSSIFHMVMTGQLQYSATVMSSSRSPDNSCPKVYHSFLWRKPLTHQIDTNQVNKWLITIIMPLLRIPFWHASKT
jgi:hypothetical protein